jgi:DNA-binding LacI/PurR family transcriptional regulator/signal transduction histidine kinase/ActR/RegA family two-component response regulator
VTATTEPPASAARDEDATRPATSAGAKRLTIAVLVDNANFFDGCYEASLREALDAKCRKEGHNLVLLYGGPLDGPGPTGSADNTIFRALRPGTFDGIIVVSSMLAAFCGPDPVARLVETFRPTCLCSIGLALPGVPSLVLDNRTSMEAAVEHLVLDHGIRRPAFLAGTPDNPEAQARLEAYQNVLARHGIPFDPSRVACGHFMPEQGRSAMDSLLAAGVDFDAVVAANDNMALGAIEALRKWGRRVPRDIPVTGFDDLPLAAAGNPPLTTVSQPLARMADLAIDTVLAQLAGEKVPDRVVLSSQFVCRRSCGCVVERQPKIVGSGAKCGADRIEGLVPRLANVLGARPDGAWVSQRLVESLQSEVAGQRRAFPKAVGDLLEDIGDDTEDHGMLQEAIGWLRDEVGDTSDIGLERAFFEALNLVASSSTTRQVRNRLMLEDSYATLLNISGQASVALDLSSLKETLIKGFPAAGVRTAFLSCARDASSAELEPVVCLVGGQPVAVPELSFPASRLLPPSVLAHEPRRTFLVFPMAVESQLLGVAAFDYADGVRSYAVFRNEITSVLKSIHLHQELVQKTMLHERSVQERLAATKRMEALSVLAGGVAHDLNNALGPLVALPDLIVRDLAKLHGEDSIISKLSADVGIIKTASLRAAQTIRDLLTLGRRGRTAKENIDFSRVVKSCVAECSLQLVQDTSRHVNLVTHYSPEPLAVQGSESQLARAIGNLLRNAIEAISHDGEIVVRTRREYLATPANRYETIPSGHYAVVTVTDNGCGIDPQDLGRVFEPFFSRKRAGKSSGSGLGLAIVHGVVREHEGFIDATSEPGTGTTFALLFPLVQAVQTATTPLAVVPSSPAKILIVDDENVQRRACRRVLTELGHQVDTVESGERAYQMFKRAVPTGRSPYDLVIMDMVLGEMLDGLQIFELIQQLFPDQKGIVASGHAPNERVEFAVEKGMVWLAKPYTIEALTLAVDRVLHRRDAS